VHRAREGHIDFDLDIAAAHERRGTRIATKVRWSGLPLIDFELVGGMLVFRFGGKRAQTIHMEASEATAPKLIAAYLKPPPALEDDPATK
jgi:hypothetical protein